MAKVLVVKNLADRNSWRTEETNDVIALVMREFPTKPESLKIYCGLDVSDETDATPYDEATVDRLRTLDGPFIIMLAPEEISTWVFVILLVVSTALSFFLKPSIPNAALRNTQQSSPNNELKNRTNQERPNERIPDIYGMVKSYPDLVAVSYTTFDSSTGQEGITDLLCVGRGRYAVAEDDIKDGDTKLSGITGASLAVYPPYTSPNYGTAQLIIGDSITEPMLSAYRSNDVVGQTLRAPNDNYIRGTSDVAFVYPNEIWLNPAGSRPQVGQVFQVGDTVDITNAAYTDGVTAVDLSGTGYVIATITDIALTEGSFTLVNPGAINPDWNNLNAYTDHVAAGAPSTAYISPTIQAVGEQWIGPFIVAVTDMTQIFTNFVAHNGLYKDNGDYQTPVSVILELEATPVDVNGTPTGPARSQQVTMTGSSHSRDIIGATIKMTLMNTGRQSVRARRITLVDTEFHGTVVDEVVWRDLYSISPVNVNDYGDVTLVHAKTVAVPNATTPKERKLNMIVTRKLPVWVSGTKFSYNFTATNSAAAIISAICLDPFIGGRNVDEVDFGGIYATIDEINEYYGDSSSSEFCYTFASDNTSFEETIAAVAGAIGCQAYRRGSVIKLDFEKRTEDSLMVFNHRNKRPGTETRQVRFGTSEGQDGVEYQWIDPDDDDALKTYYIPIDRSATNPRKVETVGVRNSGQAARNAWRVWYKMLYQNTFTDFSATPAAYLLKTADRILVADNTRCDMQDGHVVEVDGLILELSQAAVFAEGTDYVMYLQLPDGTAQTVSVEAGDDGYHVVLAEAPSVPLSVDPLNKEAATYYIVSTTEPTPTAFLVTEKTQADQKLEFKVTAANYDPRFYWYDELVLWLPFVESAYDDLSVSEIVPVPQNDAVLSVQEELGICHYSPGPVFPLTSENNYVSLPSFVAPASYTKSCKIVKNDLISDGHILSSASGTDEYFWIKANGKLAAGHTGVGNSVEYTFPSAGLASLAAVSYDADEQIMTLYINGDLVATATGIAQRTLGALQFSGQNSDISLGGYMKDLRVWRRALSANEHRLLYLSTRANAVNYDELARLVTEVMPRTLQYFPA